MLAATKVIFADHQQFYIYDAGYEHFADPALDWQKAPRLAHGYLASERAVYVSTVAPLHSHRVRVYLDQAPTLAYERVFTAQIAIGSGSLVISAPANESEDDLIIPLPPARYRLRICANSVGIDEMHVEPDRNDPMEDEELAQRDDIEYYDLFLERAA